jgi:hypothetical protein
MILTAMLLSGCAQVMAMKQPKPFTPTTAVNGARRSAIIAEVGQPVTSEEATNTLTDTYKYVDGGGKNNGGSKTVRVILYTAGDLFTLFLDQIIWMPMEKFGFAGTDHVLTIDYVKSEDGHWNATAVDDKELKGNSTKKEDL